MKDHGMTIIEPKFLIKKKTFLLMMPSLKTLVEKSKSISLLTAMMDIMMERVDFIKLIEICFNISL